MKTQASEIKLAGFGRLTSRGGLSIVPREVQVKHFSSGEKARDLPTVRGSVCRLSP